MDSRDGLIALRERVAKLTGPDREVDAEVEAALFGGRASHTFTENISGARVRRSYGAGTVFDHTDPTTNGGIVLVPMTRVAAPVTASVDAVLSLIGKVLPGWSYRLIGGGSEPAYAELFVGQSGIEHPQGDGDGPTPAIALLGAVLHALRAPLPPGDTHAS